MCCGHADKAAATSTTFALGFGITTPRRLPPTCEATKKLTCSYIEQVIEFLQLTEFVAEEEPQHAAPSASAIDVLRNRPGPRPDTVKRIYHNTGASTLDHPMISLQSMRSRALLRLLYERLMYSLTRIRSPVLRCACRTRAHAQLLVDCYLGCPRHPLS